VYHGIAILQGDDIVATTQSCGLGIDEVWRSTHNGETPVPSQKSLSGGTHSGTSGENCARIARPLPDLGLIQHWEREIEAFQAGIESAQKRLGGRK
jgi:hypothetical protein